MIADLLRPQYAAALEMLENAIRCCPPELWVAREGEFCFGSAAFHTLFFNDLSLSGAVEGFAPPPPFTLDEMDPDWVQVPYPQADVLAYVEHGQEKVRTVLAQLTPAQLQRHCRFPWLEMGYGELLLHNLRHLQHHVGQLNLLLRRETGSAPRWVKRLEAM